jgi:hypothetical protein
MTPEDFEEEAFYHLKRALTEELTYYYETKELPRYLSIKKLHFGLPSITIEPDDFRELLDKSLISTENSLVFNILDFLDELFENYEDKYDEGKEIVMGIIEKWISHTLNNAFRILKTLDKIELVENSVPVRHLGG